ncbi:MAG: hypothetical protein WCQ53_04285 [bacterium]
MKINYLSIKDFSKVDDCKYDGKNVPNCKLEKYRGGLRLSYRLPNGLKEWHYLKNSPVRSNAVKLQVYLSEFKGLLKNGYFPKKVVEKLYRNQGASLPGELTIEKAVDDYYGAYNTGKRQKNTRTTIEERPALEYLLNKFKSKYKLKYMSDFTTGIVVRINKDVESFTCKKSGRKIALSTVKSYKKLIKAFLNCMVDYDLLDPALCKTSKLVPLTYHNGKSDPQAYSRLVSIPQEVIEAVKNCSYKTRESLPDMRKLFVLASKIGPRKTELLTLSTHNLYPSPESFNQISIFDKDDCPTKYEVGFTVKSRNSIRKVPLPAESIAFIKSQLKKHERHNVYGVVGSRRIKNHKLIEYSFLFPGFDKELKRWVGLRDIRKSFKSLLEYAIKEAGLKDCTQYTLHDLRRTVNLWLRDEDFTGEQAACWLGHSLETNETSYLALRDKQEFIHKKNLISAQKLFNKDDDQKAPDLAA